MPSRDRFARPFLAALVVALGPLVRTFAQDENRPPTSLYDPRLGELRRASANWEMKRGPTRVVVDQVALVPDVPAFFDAIATWDQKHWFPVLIDDAVLAPKFLRAFRPARVLRYPGRPNPIPANKMWESASRAAARSWIREPVGPDPESVLADSEIPAAERAPESPRRKDALRGDIVSPSIESPPPGVVIATSTSPSLAGAVALAAGRFQPLIRWEPQAPRGARISELEARKLTLDLEKVLSESVSRYGVIDDDCDFITLAGEYPTTFVSTAGGLRNGPASFDDLVGRDRESLRRWAFTGRLTGGPAESVYRAMCSLFLQPKSALMFDCYDQQDADFRLYNMRSASQRLPKEIAVTMVPPDKASLESWHRVLGGQNPYGLVLINSSGGTPFFFQLPAGRTALAADIPPSVPAAVVMIHSFSAGEPGNPRSVAGSWLAGGAFLYYGSLYEPYLTSFRTPSLVSSLMNEGLPFAAALRMGPDENPVFGRPWRLHLLGDPLFRLDLRGARAPRVKDSDATSQWTVYSDELPPTGPALTENARLAWAAKTTLLIAAKGEGPASRADLEGVILAIRRETLPANLRPILDGLRIDAMAASGEHREELFGLLSSIPNADRSPQVTHAIEATRFVRLQAAIDRPDFARASAIWAELASSDAPADQKADATRRVGLLAEHGSRVAAWKAVLTETLAGHENAADWKYVRDELARVSKVEGGTAKPSVRRGG